MFTRKQLICHQIFLLQLHCKVSLSCQSCMSSNQNRLNNFTSKQGSKKYNFIQFPYKLNSLEPAKAYGFLPLPFDTPLLLWLSTQYFTGQLHSMLPLLRKMKNPFYTTALNKPYSLGRNNKYTQLELKEVWIYLPTTCAKSSKPELLCT